MTSRTGRAADGGFLMSFRKSSWALRTLVCGMGVLASAAWAADAVVVVTAAREPVRADRVAADVVVIDAGQIEASLADSLEDLLRREAGLQLSRNGPPGANGGLFIRGGNSGHTLLMVDGVRVGAATTGLPEWESLSLAAIERIEVLRGPASTLHGGDAIGGVVQVFTRVGGGQPRAALSVAAGGYGARQASASVQGAVGPVAVAASLGRERLEGVSALRPGDAFGNYNPDRDGFERDNAQLRLSLSPAAGQELGVLWLASRLDARYDASEYAPPTWAPDPSPDFRNRLDTQSLSADHRARWSAQWSTLLRVARHDSELDSGGRQTDRFDTAREQLQAQATWRPAAGHSLTLGLDRLKERADSSSFTGRARRDTDGAVLAYAATLPGYGVQAELRRDDDSQFGGVTTARLGGSLPLAAGWRLRALVGTTFRAPSFNDLFYPGYGVSTLDPERGRSVEFGAAWRQGASHLEATAYRNRVRDLIAYQPDVSQCPSTGFYAWGCAGNVNRARLQGLTLAGGTARGALALRGSLEFLDAKDEATGSRLVRRAANQAHGSAVWTAGPWRAGAELTHIGARPEGGRMLAAATLLDLSLARTLGKGLTAELRVLNATDRDYEPARDYQSLGRRAWMGLRWESAS